MKKTVILLFALVSMMASAQDIKLLKPSEKGGLTMMESLWTRRSIREFSDKMLCDQDLSDLLFAAAGVSSKDGKLTSPTARNKQEVDLYVFTAEAVYKYDNKQHLLQFLFKGDYREVLAGFQDFAKTAPINLLMVANFDTFGSKDEHAQQMVFADCGIMSQNINLFCASKQMATVSRGTMEREKLVEILGLGENQIPILNNPVGYLKK